MYILQFTNNRNGKKKNYNKQKKKQQLLVMYVEYISKFTCVLNRGFTTRLFGHLRRKGIHSKHFVKLSKS